MIPFIVSCLILVVLMSWALFGRKPVKEKPNCECGGCAVLKRDQPREFAPEDPTIPPTALKALMERERIAQLYDMGAKRKAWARDQDLEAEIYEMIGKVREGDRRG